MTKHREIIRLVSLNLSQTNIALSCGVSTVSYTHLDVYKRQVFIICNRSRICISLSGFYRPVFASVYTLFGSGETNLQVSGVRDQI